jgi:hypothetical protein
VSHKYTTNETSCEGFEQTHSAPKGKFSEWSEAKLKEVSFFGKQIRKHVYDISETPTEMYAAGSMTF